MNFNLAQIGFTTLGLVGLAVVIGMAGSVLWLLHLEHGITHGVGNRLTRWLGLAFLILVITHFGDMVMRTASLADVDLAQAWPLIPKVIQRSHYGQIWLIRIETLFVLVLIWIWFQRRTLSAGSLWITVAGTAIIIFLLGHRKQIA